MLQTFVITLREGVEAALVIAIAVAYLRKAGRADLMSAVYRALIAAVLASFVAAGLLLKLEIDSDAFEGWILLASAAFVLTMVLWMNRHGRRLKGEIETRLQKDSSDAGGGLGVFSFAFLMIFREGVETVLMLLALRLDTSGILQGFGAVAGITLAALFGVAFVRGTIRVNLGQFFNMTTAILMVVVFQLAVTGLHELSESGVLPSSRTEMAMIGPVVKNDIFFFVTILAMAGAMVLLEYRNRRTPKVDGLEGAALRKARWDARRERLWMTASCAASGLFILMITAEFIYARQSTALSEAEPVKIEQGMVRLQAATLADGKLHRFALDDQGVHVRFIVIQRPDHSFATAFDACAICGTQGYYQKGTDVVCRNCAANLVISTIGIAGGCNPIPIKSRLEGEALVIDASVFDPGVKLFRSGS